MTVEVGVAQILPQTLSSSNPKINGPANPGTSNIATRDDHVHPLLIPIGVYVDSGLPALETTSTLCYIWVPAGNYLAWDDVNQLFAYG